MEMEYIFRIYGRHVTDSLAVTMVKRVVSEIFYGGPRCSRDARIEERRLLINLLVINTPIFGVVGGL